MKIRKYYFLNDNSKLNNGQSIDICLNIQFILYTKNRIVADRG